MFPKIHSKKIVYLDNAATTPIDPQVKRVMEPFLAEEFGNPSSLHKKGREAKAAIEGARIKIAQLINARPSEIVFTAGGTESVNLAIFGVAKKHAAYTKAKPHLIASAVEHHCVINSFRALEAEGYKTTLINVDSEGFVKLDDLRKSVQPETVLISIMYANNEIGTVEPIAEIVRWLKGENARRNKQNLKPIVFHTDACQAAGYLDLNVNKLGVDLMSVNGSKIYGPKQIGFLYVRGGVNLKPIVYGGGQENGLRSGTENVAGIVGLAKALELAQNRKETENLRLLNLSGRLIKEIKKIRGAVLNGPQNHEYNINNGRYLYYTPARLPNNVNFTIAGVEGETLMLYLDAYGICASTASACSTGGLDPSHVLLAIGKTQEEAKSSIRFTLGKDTKQSDIKHLLKLFFPLVKEIKKMSRLK